MTLMRQPEGNYSFLPVAAPMFSGGVRAEAGDHIVHAVLQVPVPYQDGFAVVERHLAAARRPRAALCGVELRCAAPYTEEQWGAADGFNAHYVALLRGWGLFVGEHNPVARTNVAPSVSPPAEQVLYGFSYTAPATQATATFVLSGAAEAPSVRAGETAPDALREKIADVLTTLDGRLAGLGVTWDQATTCDVYAAQDLYPFLHPAILPKLGSAAAHGIRWFLSRPPVDNLEIELDLRSVEEERRLLRS